jgi:hypothetical protein
MIEFRIVSHSILFYWWPVWMLGFVLAALTYWGNDRLAVLPAEARVEPAGAEGQYVVALPPGHAPTESLKEAAARSSAGQPAFPVRVADSNHPYGLLFLGVLFLVIFVTNVSLRGPWSLVVLLGYLVVAVVLWVTGTWSVVAHAVSIQINLAGYLFLSSALLTLWLVALLFFDPQRYVVIAPGPGTMRVCEGTGGGEVLEDIAGLSLTGQRSDLFRHWILGFGSGDLVVRTRDGREFRFPNVLFLRTKLRMIEEALRIVRA